MKSLASVSDIPEIQILRAGFGISLGWEILQSPFYADTFAVSWATLAYNRLHCTIGDTLILLTSFWIVASVWGRSWVSHGGRAPLATFIGLGITYTAFSEYFNVILVRSWAYSQWMPTLAGIGLLPLVQWIVVPTTIVLLVRSRVTGAHVGSARVS